MMRPRVEILYFTGCPNHEHAQELVERLAAEAGLAPEIELVEVADAAAATELRFLGSPTVRIDGRDIEPGADEREDFVLSCRVYRGEQGYSGQPDPDWVRQALTKATA